MTDVNMDTQKAINLYPKMIVLIILPLLLAMTHLTISSWNVQSLTRREPYINKLVDTHGSDILFISEQKLSI